MKNGIILAGGTGSRLYPLTHVVNKHLLGVNGKFIIDYPISTLKNMGCENVTIILGGNHFSQVVDHLKDGSKYEMNFNYVYQSEPKGIAHAINLCKRYVKDSNEFAVVLGDNIFEKPIDWDSGKSLKSSNVFSTYLLEQISRSSFGKNYAQIVLHKHPELNRFGVASIDNNKIIKIEEKPQTIDEQYENYAITGCYKFTSEYFNYFDQIVPSARNEYEITDIIKLYNQNNKLGWAFSRGLWSDAGTHESLAYVNNYFYQL